MKRLYITLAGLFLMALAWELGAQRTTFYQGLRLGNGSVTLTNILTGSATIDFTESLTETATITVTGAADGDVVTLGIPHAANNAAAVYSYWVSAANTVTVRMASADAGNPVDPGSGTFTAIVFKKQ